jgi:lipopolysaccharide transport system permease protein
MSQTSLGDNPAEEMGAVVTATERADIPRKSAPFLVIEPSRGWVSLGLSELWRFRELIYFFVWRDIKVRYKQTILGGAWAIIQPLVTMLIFTLVFRHLAKIPSDSVPYPIFAYTALVPWTFFATGITLSSTSLVMGSNLVQKVYFPRLAFPVSKVLSGIVDFVLAFLLLIGMMLYYHIVPTYHVLWLPFFFLLGLMTSLGFSIWFSAMHVQFRDVQYAVPFLVQIWMWATPIAYPSSLLPEPWRTVYAINPMVGVVEGFRWALLGTATAPGPMVFVSVLVSFAILISGAFYFRRFEKTFADVV